MRGLDYRCALLTRALEEEKTFPTRYLKYIRQARHVWQVAPLEGRHGILDKESLSLFFPELLADSIECRTEPKRPSAHIVGVARYYMYQSIRYPAPGVLLRSRSKGARQRSRRHLNEATEPDPFRKPLGLQAQDGVALWMRYHRP